ncbi:hypothetical protein P3T43_001790 [Paraburkholderia sp. GAS41]|uniref:hypothetical protein n=1 Tax=Paraburkholderia sp. GAS41 TaxID=3035134 RepID=UPI003D1FFBDC
MSTIPEANEATQAVAEATKPVEPEAKPVTVNTGATLAEAAALFKTKPRLKGQQ